MHGGEASNGCNRVAEAMSRSALDDASQPVAAPVAVTRPPVVSVVIPVHNRHDLLTAAVNSILEQSVQDFELIIVDDGSSPRIEPGMLRESDRRIRIVRHETSKGAGAARNSGVAAATGEFLALLDSDDIWHRQKLEIQLEELAKWRPETLLIVACGWRYFRDGRLMSEISPVGAENLSRFASGSWFYPGSTVLMRRETALEIGPQDETLPRLEDYDWYLRFGLRGGKLTIVPMPLVDVRWHRGSILDKVRRSGDTLRRKYLERGGEFYIADPAVRRRIRSYVALSEASAAWHAGDRLRALVALTRSYALCPRAQTQIERLWTEKRVGAG
jgi:glycosyltransferase involved in cell wall biosynthesis